MIFFLIDIRGLVLVLKNGNPSQKSWKLILRTFILRASCVMGQTDADVIPDAAAAWSFPPPLLSSS